MVLRPSLYSSQFPWRYSDYPYTHCSLPDGGYPFTHHNLLGWTQTFLILITVSLVICRLSLYPSQSPWWYSDYPYTHHSLPGGTQIIPILITVSLVVVRLSLYTSQSPWWYADYPYTHHSLPGGTQSIPTNIAVSNVGTQSIPLLITISLVELRLSLYSSQSPSWYSDHPYTHHNLLGGT